MIIDLVNDGEELIFRYISDIVPRTGETISTITNGEMITWKVKGVDHFVSRSEARPNFEKEYLQIVNVMVEAI